MTRQIHAQAGLRMPRSELITRKLMQQRYYGHHDRIARLKNGTSGHRGQTGEGFHDQHVAAMTQALVEIRNDRGTYGPSLLFTGKLGPIVVGKDVRPTSDFAERTAVEVFTGNGMPVIINKGGRATPTPTVSFEIIERNKRGENVEGVVITASHNKPEDGGKKSNGQDGGPNTRTKEIDELGNQIMADPARIKRITVEEAIEKGLVQEIDLITPYVHALAEVVRMDIIKTGRFAASPLGGSAGGIYERVNDVHGTNITEVLGKPDPVGANRTRDWDGALRGDPSSVYAMKAIAGQREKLGVKFVGANDNDADRFGGEDSTGILNPNHILAVCFDYLSRERGFDKTMGIGRTIGTTHMLDLIAAEHGRPVNEVNVGFKWYVEGLRKGRYVLAGEESAGFSLPRMNGTTWVTEKDGIAAVLLMMEIIAHTGKDIGTLYGELTQRYGVHNYERIDAQATDARKSRIQYLANNPGEVMRLLEGKRIVGRAIERLAVGDGVKVVLKNGLWVLKRPSGTEPLVKDYREIRDGDLSEAARASEEIDHLLQVPA